MKKWFFIVASLFLLLASIPLFIGLYISQHYPAALETMANNNKIDFKILDYQRGWLHSNVVLQTNFPLTDQPLHNNKLSSENKLIIQQDVGHGPIIVNKEGIKFALATINTYFDKTKLAQSTLTFSNHLKSKLDIDNLMIRNNTSTELLYAVQGAHGNIDWNIAQQQFNATIVCQHLLAYMNHPRNIDNFVTQVQLQKTDGGLWVGKDLYHFNQLSWQQGDNQYRFDQFDYAVNSHITQGRYTTTITGKIAAVTLNQQNYGPQQIQLSIQGLNQQAVEKFHQRFPLTHMHLVNPYDFNQAREQFLTMLHQGAIIDLNSLQLNTAFGPVNIKANFNCPCPAQLKLGSQARIQGKIPAALADKILTDLYTLKLRTNDDNITKKEVADSLARWQKEGWLTSTGTDLFINLTWHGKQ